MEENPSLELQLFSKEQIEFMQKFFNSNQPHHGTLSFSTNVGTSSLAQKGNFLSALKTRKEQVKPWLVDSGASIHMTGDSSILLNYKPCPSNLTIQIADGSLSKVVGSGFVIVSKDLKLDCVLLVQNLDCNL